MQCGFMAIDPLAAIVFELKNARTANTSVRTSVGGGEKYLSQEMCL